MASKKLAIAVAKGDGIGPEIMDATIAIFNAAKVPLEYKFVEMGKDYYLKGYSTGMTDLAKQTVESTRILFKGPMETPKGFGIKSINVTARKVWSTFANKRVFKSLPGVETVFSRAGININLTLFRENIEDTYGVEHFQSNDVAQCRRFITRPGSEQIHRMAFEMASAKNAMRVTCCHKANIMKLTDGLFLESFYKVAKEYPHIKADDVIVDDLAMKLVTRPDKYDFVVLPNLQGDIISDLCAGLVGGLGMAPSANLGDDISIFEAVHGTAPDITGKNLANPTALLMSGIMMLRRLGLSEKAHYIEQSLFKTLSSGVRTIDLSQIPETKAASTSEFAASIIANLAPEAKKESGAVKWPKIPTSKPLENQMMKSPQRDLAKEKTVGIDVFVDCDFVPSKLAAELKSLTSNLNVTLQMISNRGTQVYPTGSVFTQVVNHYRCRFLSDTLSETQLLGVAQTLSKNLRVCSIEMLRTIDGKEKFSLAQGQ